MLFTDRNVVRLPPFESRKRTLLIRPRNFLNMLYMMHRGYKRHLTFTGIWMRKDFLKETS